MSGFECPACLGSRPLPSAGGADLPSSTTKSVAFAATSPRASCPGFELVAFSDSSACPSSSCDLPSSSSSGLELVTFPHGGSVAQPGGANKLPRTLQLGNERPVLCAFRWAIVMAREAVRLHGRAVHDTWLTHPASLSSAFSGIGALEVAVSCINAALADADIGGWLVTVKACDVKKTCRQILARRSPKAHVAGDILHYFILPPRASSKVLLNTSYKEKKAILAESSIGQSCPCCGQARQPLADLDFSGSPCVAWSSAGLRRCREDNTIVCALAWGYLHLKRGTKVLIHESVPGFDVTVLTEVLEENYNFHQISASPEQVGFPFVARSRLYHVMVRKDVQLRRNIEEVYKSLSAAACRALSPATSDCPWSALM